MAEQADGSIIIDTEVDAQGFRAGSAELQRAIKSLNTKMDSLGPTFQKAISGNASAMSTFDAKATALENTISELEAKMESLGSKRIPTEDYQRVTSEVEKAEQALFRLYDKQDKMQATGVKENSRAWQSLQYDIQIAQENLERFEREKQALETSGTAFQMGADTAQYAQLESSLASARTRLAQMRSEADNAGKSSNRLISIAKGIGKAFSTVGKVGITAFKGLKAGIQTGISKLKSLGKTASGGCTQAIGKLGKKITGLGSMMKRMLTRKLIMAMFQGIKEGVNNLAQYSSQTNASLSTLKSGLTQLKNSLATAFAPILTAVTPALATLINYLSAAITYVGKFIAALTGAKTFTKATAVQEDYAESLGNTGAAAEKAKNQLAGFDELNVLSDSSSSGGGGGASGVSPSEMFEEVPIESSITDFVDRLKAAFKAGDYAEIGRIIGNGINTALQKINDFISWDNVGDTVTKVVTGIADGFNALFETVDWELLGDTFAEGFNTVLYTIHLIITKFDWLNVAASLTRALNSFIANVDWATLGKTISDGFLTALGFIHTALDTFDWRTLGEKIGTLIANIDWEGIFKTILDIVSDIFSGVSEFRQGLLSALPDDLRSIARLVETIGAGFAAWKISSSVMSAINSIVKLPTSLTIGVSLAITGITVEAKGITDALKDGLNGINFSEIIGGGGALAGGGALIGQFFGSAILGGAIGGIIAGIPAMLTGIYDACVNGLDWLNGLLIPAGSTAAGFGIGAICAAAGTAITPGIGTLIGLAVGLVIDGIILIIQHWDEITAFLSNFFTKTIPNMWNKFVDWLKGVPKALGDFFSSLPGKISAWFSDLWKPIKDFDWSGLGNNIGQWFGNALKSAINFVTVTVPQWFSNLWNSIKSAFTNFFTVTLPKFFTETLPQAFNTVVDFVKGLPEKLWNAIKTGWNWLVDIGKSIIDGIWEGLQTVWKAITDFVGGFVQGFKDALGIHSPSTVFAEIGTFLVDGLLQGIKNVWSSITGFFSNALEGIKNFFSNAWNSIKNTASTAWNGIKGVISGAWDGIKSGVSNAYNTVKTGISNAWNSVKSTASTAWNGIKGIVSTAWSGIKTNVSSAYNAVKTGISNAWNSVKSTASTAWTNVKTTITNAWSGIKTNTSNAYNAVKTGISNAWNSVKSTASTAWTSVKTTISTAWNNIKANTSSAYNTLKSNISGAWNSIKSTASSAWNGVKSTLSNAWNGIKSNTTSAYNTLKSNISSAWNNIKSTASTAWNNIKSTIQDKGWSGVGSNICSGIKSGIDSGWSWLKNTVGNLATSLLDKAKSALGIHSPSRLFRDIVGLNIGYGIGEGIEASEDSVVDTVTRLADAIAAEANAGEYDIGGIVSTAEVDGALTGFSDKIANSFTNLLDRLQAIAEGVTFSVPAMAGSVIPYTVAASANNGSQDSVTEAITASNDELSSVIIQSVTNATTAIVGAIQDYSGTTVNLDSNSLATNVIKEINRRTRMNGKSPLTTT